MRNLQLKETEILKAFADFCEQHGLRYYLAEGTLLGAIRHQGFIPWDDDVDVMMPREDYQRFLELVQKNPIEDYTVNHYRVPNGRKTLYIIQLTDSHLKTKRIYLGNVHDQYICIDIFPIDGMPDSPKDQARRMKKLLKLYNLFRLARRNHFENKVKSPVLYKRVLFAINRCLGISKLLDASKQLSKLEYELENTPYQSSRYTVNFYSEYRQRQVFPKEYYGTGRTCLFEGMEFRIPVEAEKILSQIYGDYMKLPPEEQRVCKHAIEIRTEEEKEE